MKWFVVVVLAMLAGAGLSTWWGRVLLPEVGLHAPGYWTWFFASIPLTVGGAVATIIKEATK